MVRRPGEVLACCFRIRATFHAHHPNCPAGGRAGQGLAARQGGGAEPHQVRTAVLPLLLLLSSGTVLAGDAGKPDDEDVVCLACAGLSTAQPAAWSWQVSRTAAPALGRPGAGSLSMGIPGRAVQTMVWAMRPALQLGLGVVVEQRWTPPGAPGPVSPSTQDAHLLVGLRLDAGPRAYLVWQAPLWRPESQNGAIQARQMRVALALLPQDPYADLRRGLLIKVELSGQTTLALRPRGGHFGVLLTSHW